MIDVLPTTRLAPLAEIAKAAAGGVRRTAFLPLAVREAAQLVGAGACEAWLDDSGLALAAVYRKPGIPARSPDSRALARVLADAEAPVDGWYCVPIPGHDRPQGVLALAQDGWWSADERAMLEVAATMIGLGLAVADAGRFDADSRDDFLALLGHDLRSPLANVRVGAQLARRNLDAGDLDSVRRALEIIEGQSGRLLERLEALLDAVAVDRRWVTKLEPLDLAEMARNTVGPYRLAAEESGAGTSFEVRVGPGTPKARGDAVQIGQVLEQLVDNAAKYAPGGKIVVTVAAADGQVRLDVCDDGPGIRPEDVERVFAPFGRGRDASHKAGYGLGLYLARNIITAHGGRLWIARTSRSGTCMAFTLPSLEADAS